jgi:hypothetical protein
MVNAVSSRCTKPQDPFRNSAARRTWPRCTARRTPYAPRLTRAGTFLAEKVFERSTTFDKGKLPAR